MAGKKAQASIEFLILLGVAVSALLVAFVVSTGQITDLNRMKEQSDAKNAVMDMSAAAKEVYAQGEGAKKQVYIVVPASYQPNSSRVGNRTILLKAMDTDFVAVEEFDVHGNLPGASGAQWIWVVSEGNRVRIGDAMMEFDRNKIYLAMNSNTTANASVSVKNIWVRGINVSTRTDWISTDVGVNGAPGAFSLGTGSANPITLIFTASSSAGGIYSGQIEFTASDGMNSTETAYMPIIVDVIPCNRSNSTAYDIQGPIITSIYQDPSPALKLRPLAIFVNATDALSGNSTIRGCAIDADNAGNWQSMLSVDGAYDQIAELSLFNYTSGFALGPHAIRAKCTDSANNTGPTAYYYFNVSETDRLGPIVVQMNHTEYPTTLSNISVGGIATDSYTGNSNIQGCKVKVDSFGAWNNVSSVDGAWDSPTESFTYDVGPLGVGYHTMYYQCTDSLGNAGGIYNDSFGVVDVDLMLALDRSGSMAYNVTNATDNGIVSATSTGWSFVKNLSVSEKNGNLANLSVEIRASANGCNVFYNATVNGATLAAGNRTGTSYASLTTTVNVSAYSAPYTIALWLKRNTSGCTAYNQGLSLQQAPSKVKAAQDSAGAFLDVSGNNIQAGLVSFSTSASTDKTLAFMTPSNQTALKNAINALSPSGSTCIECGLRNACDELVSSRSRPIANKVIVLLTDGMGNVGDSVAGAAYCRNRNVTVYTIGFGNDVNDTELTNIALLTHGDYYFAPNAETLMAIFSGIGKN